MARIGEIVREIIVEPIELPDGVRTDTPAQAPHSPLEEPVRPEEEVPA